MGSTADWFAQRLGGGAPQQQQAPQQHYQPQQQYPPSTPQVPQYVVQQPVQQYVEVDEAYRQSVLQQVRDKILPFSAAAALWRGGKGVKTETESCPECGGNKYFTRRTLRTRSGAYPAPICDDCGYNGMFEQFGTHGEAGGHVGD